ncbi:unnamed protein product [Effrenium voratum]|uniref:Methylenetetrahydrofolate reductase (NAD(P)H) n=1 Tax=Effrenium voratum TaxID=2562239 RepID=A0AA36N7U8_9DINO|nr:unnamed protein product [Effrenium voratum]CAJ1414667.1 unnamed protein product [Effrenium voratum]
MISAFGLQVQSGHLLYSDFFFTLVTRPSMSVSQEKVYLKQKVDAGAEFVTQMFLDPEIFLDFQKACLKYDKVPIVGITCNTYGGLVRMTELLQRQRGQRQGGEPVQGARSEGIRAG